MYILTGRRAADTRLFRASGGRNMDFNIDYFVSYAQSNIACAIIFGILLAHDLMRVDRQEKQIKFDHTLLAFMAYFLSDTLWAAVITDFIPKNLFTVALTNFLNFVIMGLITYCWLNFVMAVQQAPHRNRPINRIAVIFPLAASVVALIILYIMTPQRLVDDNLDPTRFCYMLQILIPDIYIIAEFIYSIRKSRTERDPVEKMRYFLMGLFPVLIILGGFIQIAVLPDSSIFCLSCTILMIIFYIEAMEGQISVDPLTKLNNRGQLRRYVSQDSSIHREGLETYVMMLDINDFKNVNDSYGHAEGDRALVVTADALRRAVGSSGVKAFIGRYGGDEFTLIVHAADSSEPEKLADAIRICIAEACIEAGLPYTITVGIGIDRLQHEDDTIQKCIARADQKLYADKEAVKRELARKSA